MIRSGALLGLAAALLVAGCSSSGTPSSSAAPSSSGPSSSGSSSSGSSSSGSSSSGSSSAVRTVSVTVSGRKVTPSPGRVAVKVGEPVRLTVTSDVANEVHVHGADVEQELAAGRPSTFTVTNRQAGVYEVELHHPALLLFQFVVT